MRKWMLVLGVAAVIGCAGVSKEKYAAKEAEASQYQQQLQDQNAKMTALSKQNAACQEQASSARSELDATTAKLSQASAENDALKNRTMKLSAPLLFKESSSKLTAEDKRALDSVADALSQQKDKAIIVAGHTDNREGGSGSAGDAKRWQLSTARAQEVAKYLAGRGLDPARIGIAGFGQAKPVADNDTLANRALNRRTEIVLTPLHMETGTVEVSPAKVKPAK
jgi:chemotaxis protein MotB